MLEEINLIIPKEFYTKTSEIISLLKEAEIINLKLNFYGLKLTVNRTSQKSSLDITSDAR